MGRFRLGLGGPNFGSSGEPSPRTEDTHKFRFLSLWNRTETELARFWFLRFRFSVTSVRSSVLGLFCPALMGAAGHAQAQALDHQGAADSLKKIRVRRSSSIEVTVRWRGQEQTAPGLWRSRLELREKEINQMKNYARISNTKKSNNKIATRS